MPTKVPFGMSDDETDFFDETYITEDEQSSDSEDTGFFTDLYNGGKNVLDSITGATGIDLEAAAKEAANKKLREEAANLLNGKQKGGGTNPVNQDTGSNTPTKSKSFSDYATHPVTLGGATTVAVKYLAKQSWLVSIGAGVAVGGAKYYIDSKKVNK